jgi:glutamine amidotransferase
MTVAIVDTGLGNLSSVAKGLERIGCQAEITCDAEKIRKSAGVVVPGQGAFRAFMDGLEQAGVRDAVVEAIDAGKPYLGICLGLQILFEESEEHGPVRGLGILRGSVLRFNPPQKERLKVPHMGWNQVEIKRQCPFLEGVSNGDYFYFVHSYYVSPEDPMIVSTTTDYGIEFTSSVSRGNLFACQFHPEKSQGLGLRILRNFSSCV